jgi:hypothetical protein
LSTKQASPKPASTNGSGQAPHDALAAAIAYETEIAEMAKGIRGDATELTPALFMELLPLLRKPIPQGFIVETEAVKGKPYKSTGIKSLQVQIDRLDNVLSPLAWHWTTEWSNEGRTASVEVRVLDGDGKALVVRRARGGVNQASTDGNLLKGSETNAAKLAFARLGVGHEIYLGATDHDPDVDQDAAKAQAEEGKQPERKLSQEQADKAQEAVEAAGLSGDLPHKLRAFGVKAITDLTYEQGFALKSWIDERVAKGGQS